MIDLAVADIYSFASRAHQMQSKDFLDRLCSLNQKVADFLIRDFQHNSLYHCGKGAYNPDCPYENRWPHSSAISELI